MSKKNVCFLCGNIYGTGGTEKIVSIITSELMKKKKYNIFILSSRKDRDKTFFKIDNDIKIDTVKRNPKIHHTINYILNIPKIRKYMKRNNIDIVIDVDLISDIVVIPAILGLKTKLISWENFNLEENLKSFRRKIAVKMAVKFSDYIVTLTEKDMINYINVAKRKNKITYICNPIEKKDYQCADLNSRQIISVGKLLPIKGYDLLLNVAKNVLNEHPDWKWIILGDGPQREEIEKEIEKSKLQGKLLLMGAVENVDKYYEKSSIFVLPSKNEGFGIVLLEAKMHRLPIVCFDIETGARDLVTDGVNGNLIKKYNINEMTKKINILIENKKLREEYSKNALLSLEKYDLKEIINKWENLLDSI